MLLVLLASMMMFYITLIRVWFFKTWVLIPRLLRRATVFLISFGLTVLNAIVGPVHIEGVVSGAPGLSLEGLMVMAVIFIAVYLSMRGRRELREMELMERYLRYRV